MANGLVVAGPGHSPTGGRPPTRLTFNRAQGVVLGVALGATHMVVAGADLAGAVLAEYTERLEIALGPREVLARVTSKLDELLEAMRRTRADVRCIGVGLPGPVEFAAGHAVCPPLMPGWDRFPVARVLRDRFGADVLVDNDVNVMALGEALDHDGADQLLFVKVGTGIGLGIVAGGEVRRGAQGSAGDIGHIRTAGHDDVVCLCGARGCLEAVAAGAALAHRLGVANTRAVGELVRAGDATAVALVRSAGLEIGAVLAGVIGLLNPEQLIVGGDLADTDGHLLDAVRRAIYRDSSILAANGLQISRAREGERAGVAGAVAMCLDRILAPDAVDNRLAPV
jgi:predicted NBD/HSP70 family sugar kinase